MVKYISAYQGYALKKRLAKDLFDNVYVIFFSDFLYKSITDAIQMGTLNILCLYNEVDKKYTGSNLKTTELLDCALIWVCAVIRSNTVY